MSIFSQKISAAMPYVFWASMAFVTLLMFIELPPKEGGIPYLDKIVHIILFAWLMFIGAQAWKPHAHKLAIGLNLFGALVEPLQSILTVTRQASIYDWLADITGIAVALIFMYFKSKNKLQTHA